MSKILQKRFLIAICLILVTLFATTLEFTHLDHDCTGEDCLVCLQLEAARNVFKSLVLVGLMALFAGFEGRRRALTPSIFFRTLSPSLVSLKVQFTF